MEQRIARKSCKTIILDRLSQTGAPLAIHEFNAAGCFTGYSENCIATRLSELVKEGEIRTRYRNGKNFKEWFLPQTNQLEPLRAGIA